MKKNWIKGFDRVAVVIAVPIAVFFGIYMSNEFTNDNTLYSSRPQIAALNYTMTPNVQDCELGLWRSLGFSDSEIVESLNYYNKSHAPRLAEGLKKGFRLSDLQVITPGIPARIIVGLLWAIGTGIITVLAISVSTRGFPKTFHWLQSGFATEESTKNKKK